MRGFLTEEVNSVADKLYAKWGAYKPNSTFADFMDRLRLSYNVTVARAKLDFLADLDNFKTKYLLSPQGGYLYAIALVASATGEQLSALVVGNQLSKVGLADEAKRIYVLENKHMDLVVIGQSENENYRDTNPLNGVLVVIRL